MYQVCKQIDFCYGHRLLNYEGKCKHPHGHNALLEIIIESEELDSRSMVWDFTDIKQSIKTWVDANLDHRMILHCEDPLVDSLKALGEPYYTLKQNPTAENIARHIFEQAKELGLPVIEIRLWETPNSFATWREAG